MLQPETAVLEENGCGWRQTHPFPAFGKRKVFLREGGDVVMEDDGWKLLNQCLIKKKKDWP